MTRNKGRYIGVQRLWVMAISCCFASMAQAQIAWGPHVALDQSPLFEQTVDVATDQAGHWLVVWDYSTLRNDADPGGVRFIRSDDNAASWSEPLSIADRVVAAEGRRWSPAVVGDASGAWMVAWSRELPEGGAVIEYIHSTDHGQTWSDAQPLHPMLTEGAHNSDISLAVTSGGRWAAAWSTSAGHGDLSDGQRRIVVARSNDHGVTWSAPAMVSPAPSEADTADRHPELRMTDTGIAICVWHREGPAADEASLYLARSEDFGGHWAAPIVLVETRELGWRKHHYGTVATDERGRWMVVWTMAGDMATENRYHNYGLSSSEDDGAHWRSPVAVREKDFGLRFPQSVLGYKASLGVDDSGQWVNSFSTGATFNSGFFHVATGAHRQSWRDPWTLGRSFHDDEIIGWSFPPGSDRFTEYWPRLKAGADGVWVATWTRSGAAIGTRSGARVVGPINLHMAVGKPPTETNRIQARLSEGTSLPSRERPYFSVTLLFSEAVEEFNPVDHLIGDNFQVRRWRRGGERVYYLDMVVRGQGPATLSMHLPAGSVNGTLGGVNSASNTISFDYAYDDVRVEFTQVDPPQPITGPITVTAQFSACISQFDLSQVLVENATLLGARSAIGFWVRYKIDLLPTGTGPIRLYLQRGAGQSCYGVPSEPSELLEIPLGTVEVPDSGWTVGFSLDPAAEVDAMDEREAALASGGDHTMAVWVGDNGKNLKVSHSNDGGQTWSPSRTAFSATPDTELFHLPSLAYDGSGRWVMAWASPSGDDYPGDSGNYKLLITYSDDLGETWSNPVRIVGAWGTERRLAARSQLVSDGAGNWVVVGSPEKLPRQWDRSGDSPQWHAPYVARSNDNGATWSNRQSINGVYRSGIPSLTFDAAMENDGRVMFVMATKVNLDGNIGNDMDILFVESDDFGRTWSRLALLNDYGGSDDNVEDTDPQVVAVGDTWLAMWLSKHRPPWQVAEPAKIRWAIQNPSTGEWSTSETLNSAADEDSGEEYLVQLLQGDANTVEAFWLGESPEAVYAYKSTLDLATMTWGTAEPIFLIPGEKIDALRQAMDFAPASDGGWLGVFSSAKYYASMLGDAGDIFVSTSHGPALLRPTVRLESLVPSGGVAESVEVEVHFSHGVRAFEAEDVVVENGVVTDFQGVGHHYRFRVSALKGGPFHVEVPENVAERYTGEPNLASNRLSFSHDPLRRPAVDLVLRDTQAEGIGPIQVDAHFTTPVTGLEREGIAVSNGDVVGIASGERVQRLSIRPRAPGAVTVQVREGAVQGRNTGLDNTASDVLATDYAPSDTALQEKPTVTLQSDAPDTVEGPFAITARFNIPVTGIDLDRIVTFRGSVTEVTGSGDTYVLQVQPELPGEVVVYIQAGGASSLTGVGSRESNVMYRNYAGVELPLVLESVETDLKGLTNRTVVPFTFRFNRPVTGFVAAEALELLHDGTSHEATHISGGPQEYRVEVVGLHGEGSFQVTANQSGGIRDQNGNPLSSAAISVAVAIDTIPPSDPRMLVMPRVVQPGGEVRLYIEARETLARAPELLLAAKSVSRATQAKRTQGAMHRYEVMLQIDPLEAAGPLGMQILLEDLAGNVSIHEAPDLVAVQDASGTPLPVSGLGMGWLAALLLVAGLFAVGIRGETGLLRRKFQRRHR